MSREDRLQPPADGDVADEIRRLQREISEREEKICSLIDDAQPPPVLSSMIGNPDADPRLRHLGRLIIDWETLVARSRAVTEDDIDLIGALVRLVGDFLVIQPEGIDERWIAKLREYLGEQRAQVS